MVSANALRPRKGDFRANDWILDSGAFTKVFRHGGHRSPSEGYAERIARWKIGGSWQSSDRVGSVTK